MRDDLPTGTVTLLFSDIEGSTHLLQQLRDRYIIVLTECRHILRSAFQQWNGYEVDTEGDACFAVFVRASDGMAAAVTAQLQLATHPWPEGLAVHVRIGLHTGAPFLTPEGYVGMDVHRAARITSAGHGGQILLSLSTRSLVEDSLPDGIQLQDLGEHSLKDIQHPEHLFQVAIPGLRTDFPPLKTIDMQSQGSPITGSSHDGTIPFRTTNTIYALAWSPDRHFIASGGHDRTVQVWKATTGVNTFSYHGHSGGVIIVSWSPDGQAIASASLDRTIQVWSPAPLDISGSERIISTYEGHISMVSALAWSPSGRYIASSNVGGTDTTIQIWETSTGQKVLQYHGHSYWVRAVAWSPGGKFIASGSLKEVRVWDSATGHKIFTYAGHAGWVRAVKWSPDGRHIASTSEDKTVQLWNFNTGQMFVSYHGHADWVSTMAWSPDGKHMASASRDNIVHIWDTTTGSSRMSFHDHADIVHALTWLPDGKHIASVSGDRTMKVWRVI